MLARRHGHRERERGGRPFNRTTTMTATTKGCAILAESTHSQFVMVSRRYTEPMMGDLNANGLNSFSVFGDKCDWSTD